MAIMAVLLVILTWGTGRLTTALFVVAIGMLLLLFLRESRERSARTGEELQTSGEPATAPFLPRTRRGWMSLGMLCVSAIAVAAYAWFGPTAFRQARRMAEVREHIPVVRRNLAVDPAFADVVLSVCTGRGGALAVSAVVKSEAEMNRIKLAVAATCPPFGVFYIAMFPDDVCTEWCPSNQ